MNRITQQPFIWRTGPLKSLIYNEDGTTQPVQMSNGAARSGSALPAGAGDVARPDAS